MTSTPSSSSNKKPNIFKRTGNAIKNLFGRGLEDDTDFIIDEDQ